MTGPSTPQAGGMTPLFRWGGAYWGFLLEDRLHDRYGRHAGWLDATAESEADVYNLSGRFMGELRNGHYVLRSIFRAEPVHRAPRPGVPHLTPPAPPPDREARDPLDGWSDALPWPLAPPEPPRL